MLPKDDLLALLALMLGFPGRRARLAEVLLGDGLARTAARPEWRAPERALRTAPRLAVVIRRIGLTVVPIWWLPRRVLRARPWPPALIVRGDADLLRREGVALVGARQASASAEAWAYALARELAGQGALVVSGGARGVDAAAHRGAMAGGGATLAFLGVAADRVYPGRQRELFSRLLAQGGALVSEHLPGERTFPWAHAARNRLIAAASRAVVLAEADLGSGSLGTAAAALRIGVPVWISPPHVGRKRAGVNSLLAAGEARVWDGVAPAKGLG